MPRTDSTEAIVQVQVTFEIPERVLQWAILQASKFATRGNMDHTIAILVSSHREANVIAVDLPDSSQVDKNQLDKNHLV